VRVPRIPIKKIPNLLNIPKTLNFPSFLNFSSFHQKIRFGQHFFFRRFLVSTNEKALPQKLFVTLWIQILALILALALVTSMCVEGA
jgi:hypothetical protein